MEERVSCKDSSLRDLFNSYRSIEVQTSWALHSLCKELTKFWSIFCQKRTTSDLIKHTTNFSLLSKLRLPRLIIIGTLWWKKGRNWIRSGWFRAKVEEPIQLENKKWKIKFVDVTTNITSSLSEIQKRKKCMDQNGQVPVTGLSRSHFEIQAHSPLLPTTYLLSKVNILIKTTSFQNPDSPRSFASPQRTLFSKGRTRPSPITSKCFCFDSLRLLASRRSSFLTPS